jgi:undecaprenyl diphosphate synthase
LTQDTLSRKFKGQIADKKTCCLKHLTFYSSIKVGCENDWEAAFKESLLFAEKNEIVELSYLNTETLFTIDTKAFLCQIKVLKEEGAFCNWSFRFIGDIDDALKPLCDQIEKLNASSQHVAWLGINYSGRQSLVNTLLHLADEATNLDIENLTETTLSTYLETDFIKDPQLVLFFGDSKEFGDIFIWEIAYSEFIFLKSIFSAVDKILLGAFWREFSQRNLRYGK